jgi:anthranilate synthase/aminodeoxychorismate synthase-like glutamine amidotransferase
MLGVCLGHQTLAAALGGRIIRAVEPVHGRTSAIEHDGTGVFSEVPSPFTACRYHSLIVEPESLPDHFQVTAQTQGGEIMGIQHRFALVVGLQFHPESILTDHGYRLLANFLEMAGIEHAPLPSAESEQARPAAPRRRLPTVPITF